MVQYVLAVDRTNEKVTDLYQPHHPSVLRAIKRTVDAAMNTGIDVSVCGDMAHDGKYIPFLLENGIRTLSVDPISLPRVRKRISEIALNEARELAETLLAQNRASMIDHILKEADATRTETE